MHLQNYGFLNQSLKLFSSENICCAVRQYLSLPRSMTYPAASRNGQSREKGGAVSQCPCNNILK